MATTYEELREEINNSSTLAPLAEVIQSIMETDFDDVLNDETFEVISQIFSKKIEAQENTIVETLIRDFDSKGINRDDALLATESYCDDLRNFVKKVEPENKRRLLTIVFDKIIDVVHKCIEKYHTYNIVLPMTLEEGAQMPTYAHDTDAAADLYAAEDTTLRAHSISNMVRTGVHISLPENWMAIIVPRSSIGMKTGLRLSNSQGVIDSDYRGPLGVIYDNISDSDYEIKQGDRIAQMYIMPVYRFKAQKVDELDETDRGNGGFGSTGK